MVNILKKQTLKPQSHIIIYSYAKLQSIRRIPDCGTKFKQKKE